MNVKDHYENHLGNFYSWMPGAFARNNFHLINLEQIIGMNYLIFKKK
jgi:hypothetical protein